MSVKSIFDFRFPKEAQQEGLTLCNAIGNDMIVLQGYLDHEVIRDLQDPGHLMVSTHWQNQVASDLVLPAYQQDVKIKRVTELIGASPVGFVADVLQKIS